ncbi:dihydrofolate reductase family protein [Streptomyces sp. 8N706]|uniref:dihydrofolate reductase family protein n=1 Tax=Streptomyces sp. 8N706 TaxID=3457416 RepID=UPI003FD0CF64
MRKILSFLVSTVDGYYEGPDQEFDWPVVDAEFNEFALAQLDEADTLVFGRVTYELMAGYWPTPEAEQNDPMVASTMNSASKIVVSRTLDQAEWANTRIVKEAVEEFTWLKQQPGKGMLILGSSHLTVNLMRSGLVDELRIMVNPVALGAGKSLFRTAEERIGLELLKTRPFSSGNVLLTYRPAAL